MKYIWKKSPYSVVMVYTCFVLLVDTLLKLDRFNREAPYSKWITHTEFYYKNNGKYPEGWQQAIVTVCDNLNEVATREEAAGMLIVGFTVPESKLEPWLKSNDA